jgi:hypothetical protein
MEPNDEAPAPIDRAAQRELANLIMGFRVTQMIHVAAKLGIADQLSGGPRSAGELAQATGVQPQALYRLLRALASLGIFAESDNGVFRLTPLAELLRSDRPGSLRGLAVLYGEEWIWRAYGAMLHSVQTGETAFDHVHGTDIFGYLAQHGEAATVFHQAMTAFSGQELEAILTAYDFSQVQHVIDVGGGEGALVAALLLAYPTLRATLFDLAPAIEAAAPQLAAHGFLDRCALVSGDFFQSLPAGGDLYVLKRVIHDWPDEQSLAILKQCRAAIGAGGRLLIIERVITQDDSSREGKLFDINMMVSAGGQERTDVEYGALLAAAGFRLARVIPTPSPVSLVEATPA